MKQIHKKHVALVAVLCSAAFLDADSACGVTTHLSPRSQSVDLVRQVVGVRDIINDLKCSDDCWPGYIGSVTEFTKTFGNDITRCFFGESLLADGCCQAIKISGSDVENRGAQDWLADYFGLPSNFQSVINFDPLIVNSISDVQGYLRLDKWLCGLYVYVHLPIVNTKWNLHVCEDVVVPGGAQYAAGYFGPGTVERANLLTSFSEFASGSVAPDLSGTTPLGDAFSEDFNTLKFARWGRGQCASQTKTALADVRFWLGYDWVNCERYGFGLGLIVAAPTGTKAEGKYLFEPVIGNGHHWEFGGFVNGEYRLWQSCDGTHDVSFFTQANITHLFNSKQVRTFDLVGKPLSRYMLAEKLTANDTVPFTTGIFVTETLSTYKFAQEYTPVANLTTFCVDVSTNVQVDWVAMLTYSHCNFTWDLGYNLWYRGCENIEPSCSCPPRLENEKWALKGDAHVFGFAAVTQTNLPIDVNQPVALGATESGATIHKGTNSPNDAHNNFGVDNAQEASASNQIQTINVGLQPSPFSINCCTNTSIQSVFLTGEDIDVCSAQTKGLSNKVFTHVSYAWECACWNPYFGAGAMGEFGSNDSCKKSCDTSCNTDCDDNKNCHNCSLSQWGVWIKGGFIF